MKKRKFSIKEFLKKWFFSFPYDFESPYEKIVTWALKILGVILFIFSIYLYVAAFQMYSALLSVSMMGTEAGSGYVLHIFIIILFAIGCDLSALFLSTVILLRYMARTLPDRIYLRCFSSKEEKEKKF